MQDEESELDFYSSGEEGSEFKIKYSELKPEKKLTRLRFLWRQTFKKSVAASNSLTAWLKLKKRIILYGSRRGLLKDMAKEAEAKNNCCSKYLILEPDNRFHMFWNPMVISALLYTAFMTPYKIAFIQNDSRAMKTID